MDKNKINDEKYDIGDSMASRRSLLKGAGGLALIGAAGAMGATEASASATGSRTLSKALSRMNCRYVGGAQGPSTFDCAGLVRWSYHAATGIWLPTGTYSQFNTRHIGHTSGYISLYQVYKHLHNGDPIFFYSPRLGIGHVGLWYGGSVLSASSTAGRVCVRNISYFASHYSSAIAAQWR